MSKFLSILTLYILVAGCSQKDVTGRELNEAEVSALNICNEWLASRLRNTLGTIQSEHASFIISEKQLNIVWEADTLAGKGSAVCTTDLQGKQIVGGLIDGIPFLP